MKVFELCRYCSKNVVVPCSEQGAETCSERVVVTKSSMDNLCAYCGKYKEPPCDSLLLAGHCPNYGGSKKVVEEKIAHITSAETPAPLFSRTEYNTPRSKLLNEAMEIVHKDRNADYGSPEQNFAQIADLWNAYLKAVAVSRDQDYSIITAQDVAIMCVLLKIARLAKSPNHHDSAVDIAGYAACLADIQESAGKASDPSKPVDGLSSTLSWALF